MERQAQFDHDIVVVGGCGHVGLPLGLAFADSGLAVRLYDTDANAVDTVNGGSMPFAEVGAPEVLARVLARRPAACDHGCRGRSIAASTSWSWWVRRSINI